jgi:hypothetical protein
MTGASITHVSTDEKLFYHILQNKTMLQFLEMNYLSRSLLPP